VFGEGLRASIIKKKMQKAMYKKIIIAKITSLVLTITPKILGNG